MSLPVCPACGHRETKLWRSQGTWKAYRCEACEAGFLHPRPSAETLRRYYNTVYDHNGLAASEAARGEARALADALTSRKRPGRVLEIGSSYGVFLEEAAARGWDIQGVELGVDRVAVARERWIPTIHGTLEEARFPDRSFDAVVMRHVIEHLADPAGTLRDAARVLKPGGVLYVSCPNAGSLEARLAGGGWAWFLPPAHLFHFSPESLGRLLARSGFGKAEWSTARAEGCDGYLWNAALGARNFLRNVGSGAAAGATAAPNAQAPSLKAMLPRALGRGAVRRGLRYLLRGASILADGLLEPVASRAGGPSWGASLEVWSEALPAGAFAPRAAQRVLVAVEEVRPMEVPAVSGGRP